MKKIKNIVLVMIPILIDQIIKTIIVKKQNVNVTIIPHFLKLSYITNTGGAYGIGENSILVLIGINIFLIIAIIQYLTKNYKTLDNKARNGLILILSGGISNLIDRLFRGHVIDYIDINQLINFAIFNIADICIVVGASIVILTIFITTIKEQQESKKGK